MTNPNPKVKKTLSLDRALVKRLEHQAVDDEMFEGEIVDEALRMYYRNKDK